MPRWHSAAAMVRQLGHLTLVRIGGGSLAVSFSGVPYEASVATAYWGTIPELMEVVALAQKGDIRANVRTFPLERAIDTYEAMRTGQLDGRASSCPDHVPRSLHLQPFWKEPP